jgi:hypothetical protein
VGSTLPGKTSWPAYGASRVFQIVTFFPKTSVKAPGHGFVTARTRSWISFALFVQSISPSSGLRPPK